MMGLGKAQITEALQVVASRDSAVARWFEAIGAPEPRLREPGYETMLNTLVSQQISVAAARGIRAKLADVLGDYANPARLLAASDEDLRAGGLSRQKISYARSLAEHVVSGALDFAALKTLDDKSAQDKLTAIRGFGPWSAQVYLMFAEGRPDIWPQDDLGVQEGLKRLKGLENRPKAKETLAHAAPWQPYRTAMALFCWHVYAADKAPL
jgi:DNA-3-methyladenine glycosylase II